MSQNELYDQFINFDKNLTILQEECAELIQIICKIKRFGIDDYHPITKVRNREALKQEISDIVALMLILIVNNHLMNESELDKGVVEKLQKMANFY